MGFEPCRRNTLRGFATLRFNEAKMTMSGVAVHESHGKRWASPPARPQVDRDGSLIREPSGKIRYFPIIGFDDPDVRTAFSDAAVAAVMRRFPAMFEEAPDDLVRLAEEGAE
jgi:hypothetical protein